LRDGLHLSAGIGLGMFIVDAPWITAALSALACFVAWLGACAISGAVIRAIFGSKEP
jgi:hypothetical protein